jgi:hypothetical protein
MEDRQEISRYLLVLYREFMQGRLANLRAIVLHALDQIRRKRLQIFRDGFQALSSCS